MVTKYITTTEARKRLFDLIEELRDSEQPVYITHKGIPEVVLVNREFYEGLIATLETYEDPELMETMKEAKENFAKGEFASWEKVKKKLDLDETTGYIVADKDKNTYASRTHRKKRTKGSQKA